MFHSEVNQLPFRRMQTSEGYQNALDEGQHSSMNETTNTRALRMLLTTERQIKWPSQRRWHCHTYSNVSCLWLNPFRSSDSVMIVTVKMRREEEEVSIQRRRRKETREEGRVGDGSVEKRRLRWRRLTKQEFGENEGWKVELKKLRLQSKAVEALRERTKN